MATLIEWEMTAILLVAVVDELKGVLSELGGSAIEARAGDKDVFRRFYFQHNNVLIRVLLAKVPDPCQGGDAAAFLTARLAERYEPYFLGMVGLCAGDPRTLRLGDVVIASATVRHDFGKLTKRGRFWPWFDFEHRRESQKIKGHLTTEILSFLAKYVAPDFRVHFGIMSTCNQVTKVPGAFDYLKKQVIRGFTGDEYNRGLMALEMEAHAVAYAAEKSNVPLWLIVKGVSDYADVRKTDDNREVAIKNAYKVVSALLKGVVADLFVNEPSNRGIEEERRAQEAFHDGDIVRAGEAASKAYAFGRRSLVTRRRYLASLTQSGDYNAARRVVDEFRETGVLNDHVTLGIEATILWRRGQYQEACELLTDDVIQGRRQLLYLRAMSELFLREQWDSSLADAGGTGSREQIEKVRQLLEAALRIEKQPASPWWISVNLFLVVRLLEDSTDIQSTEFERAYTSLREAIVRAPAGGVSRLYLLLLLAIADRREEFSATLNESLHGRHIHLPLETVDMVYLRLKMLGRRGLLPNYEYYWAEICGWLRRVRTFGRPARDETAVFMQ